MDTSKLAEYLLIWVGVMSLLVVLRLRWNIPGTGLTLAYLLSLSLIHLVGAAIYLLPAYQDHDPHLTELGFEQSLYGVVAFAFGGAINSIGAWYDRHGKLSTAEFSATYADILIDGVSMPQERIKRGKRNESK